MSDVLDLRSKAATMKAAQRRKALVLQTAANVRRSMPQAQVAVKRRSKFTELDLKLKLPRLNRNKPLHIALALLLIAGIIGPTWDAIITAAKYRISPDTQRIVATPASSLVPQLKFDKSAQAFTINTGSNNVVGQSMQVGGSGYKASFPADSSKGITIVDNTNDLSLSFTPLDKYLEAKDESGHIVYPADATSTQILYTVKANGVKEDVVLQHPSGDSAVLRYRLDLPNTLEARLLPSGDLGIYSADPSLLGNVQTGSTADQQLLSKARQNAKKDHLAFVVPAPIVKEAGHSGVNPTAKFSLDGNILTVTADGLTNASYPLSIDPSFVVTSVNSFMYGGNGDDNITFDQTNNQISRTHLSGGNATLQSNETSLPQTLITQGVAFYDGYIYVLGGRSGGVDISTVYYSKINTDGSLSNNTCGTSATWCTDTALPQTWRQGAAVAYNGYLYAIGGTWNNSASGGSNFARYAKLNSDGTIASNSGCGNAWCTSGNTFPTKALEMAQAYNGIIYILGGQDNGSSSSAGDSYYSVIKPDGSPGPWAGVNGLPTPVFSAGSAVFNNTLYVLGGNNYNGSTVNLQSAVQYAHIQSNGTLSSWQTTTSLPVAIDDLASGVGDGYLYTMGGCDSENTLGCQTLDSTIRYAQINPDGTIGSWQAAASTIGTPRSGQVGAYYQGNLYTTGGCTAWSTVFNCSTTVSTVTRNTIASAGALLAWNTGTTFAGDNCNGNLSHTRNGAAVAIYNGYIYVAGGEYSCLGVDAISSSVEYAPIGSSGTIGSWSTTSAMSNASRANFGLVAYGGYIYAIDGCGSLVSHSCGSVTNTWLSAPINSNGTLGTWQSYGGGSTDTTAQSRAFTNATAYAGYIYLGVGANASGTSYSTIERAKINGDGTLGSWLEDTIDTISGNVGQYSRVEAAGGKIIFIPGADSTAIMYNTLNPDGSLAGSWQAGTPMITGLHAMSTALSHGVLYVIGGMNGSTVETTVYALTLNSSGAPLGTWQLVTSITSATACADSAAAGGYLYLVGVGNVCSTAPSTGATSYVSINNGGTGQLESSWTTNANSLNTGRFFDATVAYQGHVFVLGGCSDVSCATVQNTVETASFNADGSIGAFTQSATNNLPSNNRGLSVVVAYGYMYALGGSSGGISNSVIYTKINSGGSLSAPPSGTGCTGVWCTLSSFSISRSSQTATFHNGYLYVIGGCGNSNNCQSATDVTNSVEYAQVNPGTGLLTAPSNGSGCNGPWCTTSSLNVGKYALAAAVNGGVMYAAGGCYYKGTLVTARCASGQISSTVEYATINNDGSLSSWRYTNPLLTPAFYLSLYAYNGFLYSIGGLVSGNNNIINEVAPIDSGGGIEPWVGTTSLSQSNGNPGGFAYNGWIYILGGWDNNSTVYSSVQYIGQIAIPRIGHYTRLLDAGNDIIPFKLWLAGTSIGGSPTLDLETSTSAADSFSAIFTGSSVSLGLNSLTSLTPARYSFIRLTLDDSSAAVFPDDVGGSTAFSNFIYYFHPAPFNRLRGGSTLGPQGCNFNGGTTCQLDAVP